MSVRDALSAGASPPAPPQTNEISKSEEQLVPIQLQGTALIVR